MTHVATHLHPSKRSSGAVRLAASSGVRLRARRLAEHCHVVSDRAGGKGSDVLKGHRPPRERAGGQPPEASYPYICPYDTRNVGAEAAEAAERLPPTVGLAARPRPFFARVGPSGASARRSLSAVRLALHRARFKTSASAWLSSTAPSAKRSGSGSSLVLTARLRPSGLASRRTAAPTVGGRRLRLKHDRLREDA